VVVVNARISDRSLPGYRRLRPLTKRLLAAVELFLAQSEGDRRRLIEIGAPPERVEVIGNLKFDILPPAKLAIVDEIRSSLEAGKGGPMVVAGSTVEGEEPLVLHAFEEVLRRFPRAVLLLAPRHPERFLEVRALLERRELRFWRRSGFEPVPIHGGVLLIDSIGELRSLYALADVAFVGGSLVARGGHSMIEPAQHGVAIVVGKHTENFRDLVTRLVRQAAIRIAEPEELASVLVELLANEGERELLGRRAQELLEEERGSTERTIARLRALLEPVREARWA
jgi:3-deoxy-D-manno-octulosonic-acid transferase